MTEGARPENPKLDLAKQGTSIVAAVYAVGYLVVTFRLAQSGVTPIAWLRLQYLTAGIWCLLPFALFSCAVAFGGFVFFEPWMKSWSRGVMDVPRRTLNYRYVKGSVLSVVMLFCVFSLISGFLEKFLSLPASSGWWKPSYDITMKLGLLAVLTAAATLFAIVPTPKVKEEPVEKAVSQFFWNVLWVFGAIALWVRYIFYFSITVYPAIPPSLGGGRPQAVVFVIDPTEHSSPVLADSSRTHSIPYKLLLQTENSYVVESPTKGERVIEFKQESVRGMIVLQE